MELTIKDLKEVLSSEGSKTHSLYKYKDENVFIRTVTHHYTGKVIDVTERDLTLTKACWICDDGRFYDFLRNPKEKVEESEPYVNDVTIMIDVIIDITKIKELVEGQK
jgi:hypothetical protein